MTRERIARLMITVDTTATERSFLDRSTRSLLRELRSFTPERLELAEGSGTELTKGDPVTIGSIILGISVAALPSLLAFLQTWVSDRRRITVEGTTGAKLSFVPSRQYKEEELIELVRKLDAPHEKK